jgi:hypothetical protein
VEAVHVPSRYTVGPLDSIGWSRSPKSTAEAEVITSVRADAKNTMLKVFNGRTAAIRRKRAALFLYPLDSGDHINYWRHFQTVGTELNGQLERATVFLFPRFNTHQWSANPHPVIGPPPLPFSQSNPNPVEPSFHHTLLHMASHIYILNISYLKVGLLGA